MLPLTTLLWTLASAGAFGGSACTVALPEFPAYETRREYVVLDATPDSVGIPFLETLAGGREPFTRRMPATDDTSRRTIIYGQVFRVRHASGQQPAQLRPDATVVVIWWSLGTSCARRPPYSATQPAVRSLFLHRTARPAQDWLDGVPLFDAWHTAYLFSPELPTPRFNGEPVPPDPLTMGDFLNLLQLLPPSDALLSNDSTSVAPLFRWADEEPSRWRRTPAREALCTALRARRRPRPHCPPSLMDQIAPDTLASDAQLRPHALLVGAQ